MATAGHHFCNEDNYSFIEESFPDVVRMIDNPDVQYFPDDIDEDVISAQSDVDDKEKA